METKFCKKSTVGRGLKLDSASNMEDNTYNTFYSLLAKNEIYFLQSTVYIYVCLRQAGHTGCMSSVCVCVA